ncbi:hypothetical Protein YC6258_05201 [Gynuella sunshinyii YC6258]|uniref:Uncharacterized protein n=1 Tax=Gynuella sunshinyii YC6258 TaxID=1445510 RepID=A0A0C5VSR1_9GAMM|nr:hypothetical Protein YC6258_05201 [Gynuella sunshinyii YC6258]
MATRTGLFTNFGRKKTRKVKSLPGFVCLRNLNQQLEGKMPTSLFD